MNDCHILNDSSSSYHFVIFFFNTLLFKESLLLKIVNIYLFVFNEYLLFIIMLARRNFQII